MTRAKICLILSAPKMFEEKVVDILSANSSAASAGFVTYDVNGHGHPVVYRTAMERVHGRVRAIRIELLLDEGAVASVLEDVRQLLPGRGLTFRTHTVSDGGEI